MSRCIIIAAGKLPSIRSVVNLREDDYIICADAGYRKAAEEGIIPHLIVGDFDSLGQVPQLEGVEVYRAPVEKDDTDTMLCMKIGIQRGFEEFLLLGGFGGRFDHTVANLQTMAYAARRELFVLMADERNLVTMIQGPQTVQVPRMPGYKLSLLSYSNRCEGICERGVQYPLTDKTITNDFPLGVSNEILEDFATLSVRTGLLMILLSRDENA